MSIRMLARELYHMAKLVEELEHQLASANLKAAERSRLEQEIRAARAERDRLRAMLQGAKDGD